MKGQAAGGGRPTQNSSGSAISAAEECTRAVSIALSPPDLTSAFQEACSNAPHRTASDDRPGHAAGETAQCEARRRKWAGAVSPGRPAWPDRPTGAAARRRARPAARGRRRRPAHPAARPAARGCGWSPPTGARSSRIGAAQVALGIDVQADGGEHRVGQEAAQERQGVVLVGVVDAAQGRRLALLVQQVAQVVQQAGRDQGVVGAGLFGEVRRLQRVFELRHRFAAVLCRAMAGIQHLDVFERQHAGAPEISWCEIPLPRVARVRRVASGGCGSWSGLRPTRGSDRRSSRCAS